MEISGKVKMIGAQQNVAASFVKRELVITTDEQYPQHILIEFVQDKVDLIDNLRIGENVKVFLNLRGREWQNPQGETRYFNSILGWRVEKLDQQRQPNQEEPPKYNASTQEAFGTTSNFNEEDHDDLPF